MATSPSAGARRKDTFFKIFTGFHEGVFKVSKGKVFGRAGGMPVVMLITTGRKSGKQRSTMLTSPVQLGESVVLVASYGGDARHPAWYLNLTANPEVEAVMSGSHRTMTARVASPEEKAELWPQITGKYKGYAGYQQKTDRDIPVVILDP